MANIEVELLTRQGCHLCEAARATVAEVTAEFGLDFFETDIDSHPELLERFTHEVPVVRVNGVVKDFWQVSPRRFRKTLSELTSA